MGSIVFNAGFALEQTDKGFKYKDVQVPIRKEPSNFDLRSNFDLDAVRKSFENIFMWNKGERILNPEFGNPFNEYQYEPITPETAKNIGIALKNAVELWEPRVTVDSITVSPDEDRNEYHVEMVYTIPSIDITPETYSFVLTN